MWVAKLGLEELEEFTDPGVTSKAHLWNQVTRKQTLTLWLLKRLP